MKECRIVSEDAYIPELLNSALNFSKSEARRLVDQGGLSINNNKVTDYEYKFKDGDILKAGKRKFLRIRIDKC